jgi:hypothetical protein
MEAMTGETHRKRAKENADNVSIKSRFYGNSYTYTVSRSAGLIQNLFPLLIPEPVEELVVGHHHHLAV